MPTLAHSAPPVRTQVPTLPAATSFPPGYFMTDAEFSAWCATQWDPEVGPDPGHLVESFEAEWFGFELGLEGSPAKAPEWFGPGERAAFRRGHDRGFRAYEAECLAAGAEEAERQEALARLGEAPDREFYEVVEARGYEIARRGEGGAR